MAKILLLNGPNLNLLGIREPEIYGTATLENLVEIASREAAKHGNEIEHLQSNHEGVLVDAIQGARGRVAAIIINPGAFGHYAHVLADAVATFDGPVVELHISNPHAREEWRQVSVLAPVVTGVVQGFGADGYRLAVSAVSVRLGGNT
jgi:3-dehydroquinate dehydratase II